MNKQFLESALLFILILHTFRAWSITNQLVMLMTALLFLIFLVISLTLSAHQYQEDEKKGNGSFILLGEIRFLSFLAIVILILGYLLTQAVVARFNHPETAKIHDGLVLTEAAAETILIRENPYSISYNSFFERAKYGLDRISPGSLDHYTYSPLMFLLNIPFFRIGQTLFNFHDFRITLIIFFVATAIIASLIVRKKLLFGMFFLLNPFFLPSILFGANDVIPLLFLILTLAFLDYKKIALATMTLGVAAATKLTVVPFIPLYFLYLFFLIGKNERFKLLIKQVFLFVLINLIFYLPFLVWNFQDFIDDVLIYHLQGGVAGRPIAGFLGIPQLLTSFSFISQDSNFPFYLFSLLAGFVSLPFFYYLLKKSLRLAILCVSFVVYFILIFSFSRILQTDYLAFLSQILLLSGFVSIDHVGTIKQRD